MPTLVCVPLMVSDISLAAADAGRAKEAGADCVEFRIDPIAEAHPATVAESVASLVQQSPLPCIITCRIEAEGGVYTGTDVERAAIFRAVLRRCTPSYVDIEAKSLAGSVDLAGVAVSAGGDAPPRIVLSSHDFSGRPADLARRMIAVQDPRGTIAKLVYRARSLRDSLEILDLPAQTDRPTVALGMGEFGLMTRVLAPKFGGFLTFASLNSGSATAPGQPTIDELLSLYRFRAIDADTKVYGVIGWPVTQSRSPATHNAWFAAARHNGVYLPLPIAPGDDPETTYASLKATLLELIHHPRLKFSGASVTIPFKEHLVRLAREQGWTLTPPVLIAGAANTIVVVGDSVTLLNTDWDGVLVPLRAKVGDLKGKGVLVLGAGGAARAAAAALSYDGARVTVSNRDSARAARLVADLTPAQPMESFGSLEVVPWELRAEAEAEVVLHCTPMGSATGPAPTESPLDAAYLRARGPLVFDMVYTPPQTPLLMAATAAGCRTISGMAMFEAQASAQFEAWVGRPPPAQGPDLHARGG